MRNFVMVLTVSFSVLLCWMIYLANTGQEFVFFRLAHSVTHGDKIAHALIYGTFAFLFNLLIRSEIQLFKVCSCHQGSLFICLFVTVEEFSQLLLPTRTFDIYDYIASLVGITIATLLTTYLARAKRRL